MTTTEKRLLAFAGVTLAGFAAALWLSAEHVMEVCRVANVPLALAVAAGFFVRVNDAWHRYGLGGRLTRAGVLGVLVVVAGGSAEAYVTHVPLGFRSVVMTLALTLTGMGLALIPHDEA